MVRIWQEVVEPFHIKNCEVLREWLLNIIHVTVVSKSLHRL